MDTADLDRVCAALRRLRCPTTERELQIAVDGALTALGVTYAREHRFTPHDIVDFFLAGTVALECKVDGATGAVVRQLDRYAAQSSVTQVVLLTTRYRHAHGVPPALHDTPVRVEVLSLLP
jgi:hypothetical protein